jgi:hypothetical protein
MIHSTLFRALNAPFAKCSSLAAKLCSCSPSHDIFSPRGHLANSISLRLSAAFLVITGLLTTFGIVPLRSGSFLLEGLELMGPVLFFLAAAASSAIGFALILRWPSARRLAILVFALFGFAAIPSISSAVMEFPWFVIATEGAKLLSSVLVIFYLRQPDVVAYFQY